VAPRRDLQRAARQIAEKYLRKGSKVYLEGALRTRKWTDQGGQERYTTEIVLNRFGGEWTMLDGARGTRGAGGPPMEGGYDEGYGGGFDDEPAARGPAVPARPRTPVNDLDDDIPF
jgi:single-strand DNA-binding protein